MRYAALLLALWLATVASAMGFSEDPGEVQKRNYDVFAFNNLTVRGEGTVESRQGDHYAVTLQTTRALFEQLTVYSLFGEANIAIETGLRGPRETGAVQVWITVPRLNRLLVLDHSSVVADWPSDAAWVSLRDNSVLDLSFSGKTLTIEAFSRSRAVVTGTAGLLSLYLRTASQVAANDLSTAKAELELDEGSSVVLGPTARWTGVLRRNSTATSLGQPPQGSLTQK